MLNNTYCCTKLAKAKTKIQLTAILATLAILAILTSCNDKNDPSLESNANSTLQITTRNLDESTVEVPMPMHIYIFNESQQCVYNTIVTSLSTKISAELPAGKYSVSILAGADPKVYSLPDKKTATPISVISLRDAIAAAHQRLAFAQSEAVLTLNGTTKVDATLTHIVAQASAVIKKIPAGTLAVSVEVGGLHTSFSLDGKYDGVNGTSRLLCTLDKVSGDWVSPVTYILPAKEKSVPISVRVLQSDGSTDVFSYNSSSVPVANQAFQIQATYANTGVFSLGVSCSTWGAVIQEAFDFDDETVEGEKLPELNAASLPERGSIWQGAFVADVSGVSPKSAKLLLMSIHEWPDLTLEEVVQHLDGYDVCGGKGWRVPTDYEVGVLRDTRKMIGIEQLDLLLRSSGGDVVSASGYTVCSFWSTGEYGKFSFSTASVLPMEGTTKLRLRAVKRVKINLP